MLDRTTDIVSILDSSHSSSIEKSQKKKNLMEHFKKYSISLETRLNFNLGDTMLLYAAKKGYLDILQILLELGADKNSKDELNDTALNWASYNGHTDCVAELIRVKVDLDIMGYASYTALSSAILQGNKDCMKLLIAAGASIIETPKTRYSFPIIMDLLNSCDQRDSDIALAITKLCDQLVAFSKAKKKLYGFENKKLKRAKNYIGLWHEFSRIYKENAFLYLDLATNLHLPIVILDLILQYDRDNAPLHDGRLEKFSATDLNAHLDREIHKNRYLLTEMMKKKHKNDSNLQSNKKLHPLPLGKIKLT